MTFLEMQTYVRTLLAEDVAAFWTQTQIKQFVNRSYMTVYSIIANMRREYFLSSSSISYVAGTELYALPAGMVKLTLVERADQDPKVTLYPIDITEKNEYSRQAGLLVQPGEERYFLAGAFIGIAPVPVDTITNALKLYVVNAPTPLVADGDTLPSDLTELDHEVIAWGAYMRAAARDKQLLATIAPVYKELKDQLINNTQTRVNQEPVHIIDRDPYLG